MLIRCHSHGKNLGDLRPTLAVRELQTRKAKGNGGGSGERTPGQASGSLRVDKTHPRYATPHVLIYIMETLTMLISKGPGEDRSPQPPSLPHHLGGTDFPPLLMKQALWLVGPGIYFPPQHDSRASSDTSHSPSDSRKTFCVLINSGHFGILSSWLFQSSISHGPAGKPCPGLRPDRSSGPELPS